MSTDQKRLFELTEKEFFLKTAQVFRGVLTSMEIVEKLEPIQADKLVPRTQVAKEYGISLPTLSKWVQYGQIPKPIKKGGRVYFSRKELDAFNQKSKKK